MSDKITYLVTGANRGIGLGMTRALLLRPDTVVIATVRHEKVSIVDLEELDVAVGSRLIIIYYSPDKESPYTAATLVKDIAAKGVNGIDVVISNLGIGTDFKSCEETTPEELLMHFQINTIGPIELFQAVKPHLKSSSAKFILISSSLGSIGGIEAGIPYLAYGVSKAAANFFVRKLHFEEKEVISLAIHPGWVRTENGQNFADAVGVEMPPMTVEQSVQGVLKQIDVATKESTSGTFVGWDGIVLPW